MKKHSTGEEADDSTGYRNDCTFSKCVCISAQIKCRDVGTVPVVFE